MKASACGIMALISEVVEERPSAYRRWHGIKARSAGPNFEFFLLSRLQGSIYVLTSMTELRCLQSVLKVEVLEKS